MTKVDLIALGFVALTAFIGWKKGLVASALSVAGIVFGAWLGSRVAPALLQGGRTSPYTPLAALAGGGGGGVLFGALGALGGGLLRGGGRPPRPARDGADGGRWARSCSRRSGRWPGLRCAGGSAGRD